MATRTFTTDHPGVRAALERLGRTVNHPDNELEDDNAALKLGLVYIGYVTINEGDPAMVVSMLDLLAKSFEEKKANWEQQQR